MLFVSFGLRSVSVLERLRVRPRAQQRESREEVKECVRVQGEKARDKQAAMQGAQTGIEIVTAIEFVIEGLDLQGLQVQSQDCVRGC